MTLAVVAGYFLGKLSYQTACEEKFMAMPNSHIGDLLRKKRKRTSVPQKPTQSMLGAQPADIYSDARPGSSLELDTSTNPLTDQNKRPGAKAKAGPSPPPITTYEDLRRKNRELQSPPPPPPPPHLPPH